MAEQSYSATSCPIDINSSTYAELMLFFNNNALVILQISN